MSAPHPANFEKPSRTAAAAMPTVDRRRAPRSGQRKLTNIYLPHDGAESERVAAFITDLSATGLGMAVARPLVPGQRFHLDVNEAGALTPLLYAVVRCEPWKGNCYRVGAILLEVAAPSVKRPVTTEVQRVVARLRRAVGN